MGPEQKSDKAPQGGSPQLQQNLKKTRKYLLGERGFLEVGLSRNLGEGLRVERLRTKGLFDFGG